MENLALLKKILNDYSVESDQRKFQEAILAEFCAYAENWLRDKGVIGVGHTAEGLAVRLTSGEEYLLTSPASDSVFSGVPVSVTGNTNKIEKAFADFTQSFPITGR